MEEAEVRKIAKQVAVDIVLQAVAGVFFLALAAFFFWEAYLGFQQTWPATVGEAFVMSFKPLLLLAMSWLFVVLAWIVWFGPPAPP